jgi:hypothetical protein
MFKCIPQSMCMWELCYVAYKWVTGTYDIGQGTYDKI